MENKGLHDLHQKSEDVKQEKLKAFDFTDKSSLLSYKEIFIAEYNSLRSEIVQRISQQTTINQIIITAWGVILSYALGKTDENSYYAVYLILVYPVVAYFISFGWAFNNTRICQIAEYLRKREIQISSSYEFIGWENYIKIIDIRDDNLEKGLVKWLKTLYHSLTGINKIKPGKTILAGTQVVSIVLAVFLIIIHKNNPSDTTEFNKGLAAWLFTACDSVVIWLTLSTLRKSGD